MSMIDPFETADAYGIADFGAKRGLSETVDALIALYGTPIHITAYYWCSTPFGPEWVATCSRVYR